MILDAARGSIMVHAWLTEVDSGKSLGTNPGCVAMFRTVRSQSRAVVLGALRPDSPAIPRCSRASLMRTTSHASPTISNRRMTPAEGSICQRRKP